MGDQIGEGLSSGLSYIDKPEISRILNLHTENQITKGVLLAEIFRLNCLYMIAKAGSGHIGSSFSSMDLLTFLKTRALELSQRDKNSADVIFSSKGHDAPAVYSIMLGLGELDFDLIHKLRRAGGLPGHPDISTPNIVTNTGSLGMGISKAKGMIYASRLRGIKNRLFVLTGDGELQEGQIWESLASAAYENMDELTVVVDHNKLQSDTLVKDVSDLGDLEAKFEAFGWAVLRCDGNNYAEVSQTFATADGITGKPVIIIADTIKGKGVSFMEHTSIDSDVELYKFHSGAPSMDAYQRAVQEIKATISDLSTDLGCDEISISTAGESPNSAGPARKLIPAYTAALIKTAAQNKSVVALDADLVLDTGLIPFREEFPERFVECGIAEQDMVSRAGGMARYNLLPIVHSFACFLASRAHEQIYNNASENSRIIYVGSLAGVVPGGPGHSHQSTHDIGALASIPGMVILEPRCEEQVSHLLNWAAEQWEGPSYMRLFSAAFTGADFPERCEIVGFGQGEILQQGTDIVIFAYGPLMVTTALEVAKTARNEKSISIKVIALPWLNKADSDWVIKETEGYKLVVCLDNHSTIGGQGDLISSVLAGTSTMMPPVLKIGADGVPQHGSETEVLAAHGLSKEQIMQRIALNF